MQKSSLFLLGSVVFGLLLFSSVYAQTSGIPDWVKNNAKWWAEGQIGESEYVSAIQFLIGQGIIEVPITQVSAASISLSDDERAQSFVVSFSDGDFGSNVITINTFSQFFHFSETVTSDGISNFQDVPAFVLRSLPSGDKQPVYALVDRYVNAGKSPEPFDVSVDVMAGNGTIIQTWDYRKCGIVDYAVYVNDEKDEYRFSNSDGSEIRDVFVIECSGFSLKT